MTLSMSGLASGFDWQSLIAQMIQVERTPESQWQAQQSKLRQQNSAYGSLKTELTTLQSKLATLQDAGLYTSNTATVSDPTVATATSSTDAPAGTYAFNISKMATAATLQGKSGVSQPLSLTDDVSGLTLSAASFATPVTAGTFSVNGRTVNIATSDTLKQVFDKISTATNGKVTGSYSAASDEITLSSSAPIVLGGPNDTSNFLQAAQLNFNNSGTVTSANKLGGMDQSEKLANANFASPVSDGGSGAGQFNINGVAITYNATTDTVTSVLNRINSSNAGVVASYDKTQDRFLLTSTTTGDRGIAVEDVSGNFAAKSGLITGATLQRGQNLTYTINGGGTLTSLTNTITADGSGLTGVTVNALKAGTATVQVATDVNKISGAINDFVAEYNKVQSLIDTDTASTTDAQGNVTAGILTGDWQINDVASALRGKVAASLPGLSGTFTKLTDMGFDTNGTNNNLTLTDSGKLSDALASKLSAVKSFFTDSTNGLGTKLTSYLSGLIGDNGMLTSHQTALSDQSTAIDNQIAALERTITSDQQRMITQFTGMESAMARINQQQQFLTQNYGTSSGSSAPTITTG
jgi:flagellar hook-associated protein 2